MKNKGFTLIELLAVIVILAIIALIAVPIILNIINNAKESSSLRKGELYLDAVEQAAARKNLDEDFNPNTCEVQSDGNLSCDGKKLVVEVDGEKPTDGTITFDRGIVKKVEDLTYKDVVLETDENGNLRIKKGSSTETTPSDPEVKDPVSFKDDDWDTIVGNVRKGNISKYKVGDTKQVDLGSLGVHTLRIANTTTPVVCSTQGFSQTACGFVLEFADIINMYSVSPDDSGFVLNTGGYNGSELRTYLKGTIYEALPQKLKDIIIDTYVVSGHGLYDNDNQNFVLENEKLYLLSPHEVWEQEDTDLSAYYSNYSNTRQLDYYLGKGLTTRKNLDVAIKITYSINDGVAAPWWLRDARSDSSWGFFGVNSGGGTDIPGVSYNSSGISPAFRIG